MYSDDFLITADKNPNSRGAAILGPAGPGTEESWTLVPAGTHIIVLFVFHHDLTARGYELLRPGEALGKVDCVVFQGSWDQPTAGAGAHSASFCGLCGKGRNIHKYSGTGTRFNAAVPPLGNRCPEIEILARLAGRVSGMPEIAAVLRKRSFGRSGANVGGIRRNDLENLGKMDN